MIRQDKAIEWLTMLREKFTKTEYAEYLDMAIKALEAESCEDCVSRQAVIELAEKGVLVSNGNYKSVCNAINELPSVNPQQKTGHWIKIKPYPLQMHEYECSECLHETDDNTENYCSECGAKMESEEGRNDNKV